MKIIYLGPGEVLFLKFHAAQNQVMDLVQPDTVLKRFCYEDYAGTRLVLHAQSVKDWGLDALDSEVYSRGDYRLEQTPDLFDYKL